MREIKFRLWNLKNKYMFSNDNEELLLNIDGSSLWSHKIHYYDGTDLLEIDDFEIMQYTGLKDINGVEIYEGDIVKTRKIFIKPRHTDFTEGEGKVIFSDCSFYILQVDSEEVIVGNYSPHSENTVTQIEVIGNIYENPELLED